MEANEIAVVRRQLIALGARAPNDGEATLRLLAHAYAAAASILDRIASLRSAVPTPATPLDLHALLAGLDGSNARVLYGQLLALLAWLDADLGPGIVGMTGGAVEVNLGGDSHIVRWWPRVDGPGVLRRLYDRRYGATRYDYGPEAGLRHVALSLVTQGLEMKALPSTDPRGRRWPIVGVPGDRLRVLLSPLPGVARPRFRVAGDPPAIGPDEPPITDLPGLLALLDQLLADAREQRADLLILPELMIPPAARDHLCRAVAGGDLPLAVVAGSAYVPGDGGLRNEAVWIDRSGRVIGTHHKRGYFGLRAGGMRGCPGLSDAVPDAHRLPEDIVPGRVLRVAETAAGRVGLLICADLLDMHAPAFRHLVEGAARLDLLLVVSFSPVTGDFRTTAEGLHRVGTSTLFVNAACVAGRGEDRVFVSSPFRRDGPDRWTDGECAPSLSTLPGDRGVLVDLARWWD